MAKVFLTAGHGGSDPGAVGHNLKEKDINLNIMLACKSVLENNGVTVVCSRLTDENDPVGEEVREANNSKADVAVSFHTNAGGGNGSETYYYSGSRDSKRLAELCESQVKAIGQNSRGIKNGDRLYFVKNTKMTSVLCECAFIDNAVDKQIIDTTEKQTAFGVAYAKAILEYLGSSVSVDTKPEKITIPESKPTTQSSTFTVKIDIPDLNIRKGPGVNFATIGKFTGKGVFTIIETSNGWGKLKSGLGWINLSYTKRI